MMKRNVKRGSKRIALVAAVSSLGLWGTYSVLTCLRGISLYYPNAMACNDADVAWEARRRAFLSMVDGITSFTGLSVALVIAVVATSWIIRGFRAAPQDEVA
ncbi:hypothetical protein ACFB49_33210 [Sphingomonas sp. DBB INV C78]